LIKITEPFCWPLVHNGDCCSLFGVLNFVIVNRTTEEAVVFVPRIKVKKRNAQGSMYSMCILYSMYIWGGELLISCWDKTSQRSEPTGKTWRERKWKIYVKWKRNLCMQTGAYRTVWCIGVGNAFKFLNF
jgi:hypothetical protein